MSTESAIWKNLVIHCWGYDPNMAETRHKLQGFIYLLTEKHMFFFHRTSKHIYVHYLGISVCSFQSIFKLPLPSAKNQGFTEP
jgi:hypothetical protein